MIIGTAGHIDHGKTALVRALTGVDCDRLKEEKARGITIDLGFAYLPGPSGDVLGFIDVPGHERLVHTMLAGASGIDFALLVIAADDGVMPQTREHLAIIDLLGIRHGLVALTKTDLASEDRMVEVTGEIRAALGGTALAEAEILPVSALTGLGIDDLRDRLFAAGDRRKPGGAFRLAVDRAFSLSGVGTVATGTILSGAVRVNDHVILSPSGLAARVRSLHVQNWPAGEGFAGDRCALNLVGDGISKEAVHRGDMALDPALYAPTDRVDAVLRVLAGEPKPIGQWFPVRLHHASAEVGARIVPLGDGSLEPGAMANVQLVLERPIAAACGDRYIIRDVSAQRTIGGGVLVDLRAPARRRRTPDRRAQIEALSVAEPAVAFAQLLDTPPFAWDLAAFARDHALSADETETLRRRPGLVLLETGGQCVALSAGRWGLFRTALLDQLSAFHAESPDLQGIGREKLRLALQPRLPQPAFVAALQWLIDDGDIALDGAFVRLASHQVRLTDTDESTWAMIAPMLGGDERFRPPRVRDIAGVLERSETDIRRLLKLLSRLGRVDQVAHDHFFLRGTVAEMVGIVAALGRDSKEFTAAQFRDQVLNGRKVAIQILEFFDRHGVTMRRGDLRRINRHRLDLFGPVALGSHTGHGRESSPVGRSDFKSEWGSEPVPGGFDSHSLPPRP